MDLKKVFLECSKKVSIEIHNKTCDWSFDTIVPFIDCYDISLKFIWGNVCELKLRKHDGETITVLKKAPLKNFLVDKKFVSVDVIEKSVSKLFEDVILF